MILHSFLHALVVNYTCTIYWYRAINIENGEANNVKNQLTGQFGTVPEVARQYKVSISLFAHFWLSWPLCGQYTVHIVIPWGSSLELEFPSAPDVVKGDYGRLGWVFQRVLKNWGPVSQRDSLKLGVKQQTIQLTVIFLYTSNAPWCVFTVNTYNGYSWLYFPCRPVMLHGVYLLLTRTMDIVDCIFPVDQ